jgi:hypothetical protein
MEQSSQKKPVMLDPIQVVIINASDRLSDVLKRDPDADVSKMDPDEYISKYVQPALQEQVDAHFAPAWGITAELIPHIKREDARSDITVMLEKYPRLADAWWLVLLDRPTAEPKRGVSGYHDVAPAPNRRPIAKVFVETDRNHNRAWTKSASHELLEMLADQGTNATIFRPTNEEATRGQLYAYEVCDPCDADRYEIPVDGKRIQVSNFVYPAWFEWFRSKGTRYAHVEYENMEPFQLRPGGFIYVLEVPGGNMWHEMSRGWDDGSGEDITFRLNPPVGSRRRRRVLAGPWGDASTRLGG